MTTRTVEGWTLTWLSTGCAVRADNGDASAEASADGLICDKDAADGEIAAYCPRAVVEAMFAMLDECGERASD